MLQAKMQEKYLIEPAVCRVPENLSIFPMQNGMVFHHSDPGMPKRSVYSCEGRKVEILKDYRQVVAKYDTLHFICYHIYIYIYIFMSITMYIYIYRWICCYKGIHIYIYTYNHVQRE